MRKSLTGSPIQTLKFILFLLYSLATLQITYTLSARKKEINTLFIRKIYSCVPRPTRQMTLPVLSPFSVLLPICTKKLHLKTLISRTSHPQCVRVTCSLFFELEMIFAIKNRGSSLHSLSSISKLDAHDLLPWISAPWKKGSSSSVTENRILLT